MIELSVTITGLISAFSVCSESQCEGICLADKCFNMLHWSATTLQSHCNGRRGEEEMRGLGDTGPSCHSDQGYSTADKHCFQRCNNSDQEGIPLSFPSKTYWCTWQYNLTQWSLRFPVINIQQTHQYLLCLVLSPNLSVSLLISRSSTELPSWQQWGNG